MSLIIGWASVSLICSFNMVTTAPCWTLDSSTMLSAVQPLAKIHHKETPSSLHSCLPPLPQLPPPHCPALYDSSHFSSPWSLLELQLPALGLGNHSFADSYDDHGTLLMSFSSLRDSFLAYLLSSAWKQWPLRLSPVLLFTVGKLPWKAIEFLNYWAHVAVALWVLDEYMNEISGRPKSLFRFFCKMLWKNPNELFDQPNTWVSL